MKKTLLILGCIGLVCLLLIVRLFFKQDSSMVEERKWFASALRYEFSAHVDSVRMFNESTGRLWCRLTKGDPQVHREDSLKLLFKEHDMLYLIFHKSGDSIIFLVPNGNLVAKGDSVRVSSQDNSIRFFRNGTPVASDELSNTFTGYGRPFFLKGK
jgi:hypothetical protein